MIVQSSSFLLLICALSLQFDCALSWHASLVTSLDAAQRNRHLLNRLPDRSHPPDDGSHFTDARGLVWTRLPRSKSLFHHPRGLSGSLIDWAMGKPERYWKFDSAFLNSNGMWSSYEAVYDVDERRWVHEDATFNLCAPQQHPLCHAALDVVDYLTRAKQQLPTLGQLKERIGAPHPDLAAVLLDWHFNWFQPSKSDQSEL